MLFIGPLLIAIGLYDTLMRPGIHMLPLAAGFLLLATGLRYRQQARASSEAPSKEPRPYV
jgi:hypothetical protein